MTSFKTAWVVLVLAAVSACQCGRQPPKQTLMKEGEACESDELCETGLCDAAPGFAPVCVRKCADGCSLGEVCVQLTPNRFACQPDLRKLCQPCNVDADCPYPSDKCLVVNNEKVCGRDCAFDQNCPTGYRCVNGQGVDGQPKVQQCVPTNASCACLARGDFQQACQVQNATGTCLGIKQCDLVSNSVVCDARDPVAETCNGLDDDCDGEVDEDQPSTTCGVGACERQVSSCADGGTAVCMPGAPGTESCNGIDDDCDGTIDDGFDKMTSLDHCSSCNNRCTRANATPVCVQGDCRIASCLGTFRDCNQVDADGCETDIVSDSSHCGACNNTCTRPNSTGTCVNQGCQFTCTAPYKDLNGDPTDGCEYRCPVWPADAVDLPDLMFVDANCDGIDGEVMNGVFVATTGLDANPGTRAQPKRTIANALTTAGQAGKRDVYVSSGTYTGPLVLNGTAGINVAGGYDPTTWQRSQANAVTVTGGNPALDLDSAANVLVQSMQFEGANADATRPSAYAAIIRESSNVKLEGLSLRAGNGRNGSAGTSRTAAAGGNPGTSGLEGCYNDPRTSPTEVALACNFGFALPYCSTARAGGAGGTSTCGATGGSGGSPSRYNPNGTPSGANGGAGSPSGGAGGQGVPPGTTPATGSIYFGSDGAPGSNGNDAVAPAAGTFASTGYVLAAGGDGTAGTAGRGGGGGGGGAGGLGLPLWGIYAGISCYSYGSAGGGGGSGGCGGAAGTGGEGGGASIGLFLWNSTVSAQGVTVRTGNGGNGGPGGSGGAAGSGGSGASSAYDPAQGDATRGGGGGRGGNGGRGGHGAGGAGGSVFGVVRNSGSTWNPISGFSYMPGTPGTGGTSSGNSGPTGASGVSTSF